jgi:hypothetical protein
VNLTHADSSDPVVNCPGCTIDEASWEASRVAPINSSINVYVADFHDGELWRFHSSSETKNGKHLAESFPLDLAPEVEELFNAWLLVKDIDDYTEIELPNELGVKSVLDLVGHTYNYTRIANYIFENKSSLLYFPEEVIFNTFSFMSTAASRHYTKSKNIEIGVLFPDSSRALFRMYFPAMLDKSTVRIKYVEGFSEDSDGNKIPDTFDTFAHSDGELYISDINGRNFSVWKDRAERMGFELRGNWQSSDHAQCDYLCDSAICTINCREESSSTN